jgi:hypothetical protein
MKNIGNSVQCNTSGSKQNDKEYGNPSIENSANVLHTTLLTKVIVMQCISSKMH